MISKLIPSSLRNVKGQERLVFHFPKERLLWLVANMHEESYDGITRIGRILFEFKELENFILLQNSL